MSSKIALASKHLGLLFISVLTFFTTSAAEYVAVDIGGGNSGALLAVPGGYDVTSASRDIGGTADQFEFAYQKRTGDFDLQVRLEGVTITDPFVHAGLMARESTDPSSSFAAIFSSSALLGAFFESRAATSATALQVSIPGGFPVNYPQMYLRLRRSGSTLTGFASFDGGAWQQLGTASITLPSELFVGLAVSSLNTNAAATARFRDIGAVTNQSGMAYKPVERLGPSNRRTGLVFSEIMYHPAPRSDGEDLEFIELFNAESVFIDMTGWRLAGAVDFAFPDGFRLESGQFAVIAANPASLERVYGYRSALGPFSGHLDNSGETLKLLNRAGATRLEVNYKPNAPWPVAADGAGHSLVLARPSFGENDPRAWSASDKIGGSPGDVDAHWPNPWRSVVINELLANSSDPQSRFIELYNAGKQSVDISGCVITDDPANPRFRVPPGTFLAAQDFLKFTEADLKFPLGPSGNTIFLLSPALDRVLDVIRFSAQEKEVSLGRAPDGAPELSRLQSATPAAQNSPRRIEDIVINEVMYAPLTGDEADSYVELHNRSSQEVDVSGWRLLDAITYHIPEGQKIPPQGFLVIAKDAAHLSSNYSQLNTNNTLGNFSGKLSNNGDHIVLAKRDYLITTNALNAVVTNATYITLNEFQYQNGGRWPELAAGGGSSLELTDPRADLRLAGSWAASDETQKAPWTTVEVTARVELGTTAYPANRIQVLMQGSGECLVDDIELIPANSTNLVVNGDFETATNTWRFFGNHSLSAIESTAAFSGQNGLHIRSPGDGDTGNNTIRGTLVRALPTSGTATLRAKVRWLAGWPEVLFRVRGNWLELPARMQLPKNLGTPGLPNSRLIKNAPPAIYDVTHSPALPRANESVTVTCRLSDPDGIGTPRLVYRIDPSETVNSALMRDDGTGGDVIAHDGVYTATIPGKSARTLVAFRIQATDDAAQPASSQFPTAAPAQECLIVWDETIPFGTFAHYHMWSTAATEAKRGSTPDLDNTFRDATLVYGNARVIYNVGFRDKGSPYHNGAGDFAVTTPKDDELLGIDDRVFASTGNGGNEGTDMKGDVAGWVAEQLGIPFLHSHYMRLYRNGSTSPYREVMYDMEQPNRYFAKSWFSGGGVKDDLFKIAIWFEFDDNNSAFSSIGATLEKFISGGQYKLARYRWNWQLRPSTETANDYSSIFNLAAAANAGSDRVRLMSLLADMEEWMRVFAYHRITGNWDSYTYNVGQNMYLYAPLGQRAALLPWDIDFVLGDGEAATAGTLFTAPTDGIMQQVFNLAPFKRMLWRAYQDAANGLLLSTNFQPQIDARRNALRKNGVNAGSPGTITTYMNARRNYIANQLKTSDTKTFAITSNGGADITSSDSTILLAGSAPFAVASIEVNGIPFPINWTSSTNWQISVPLGGATNVLALVGRDLRGQVVSDATDSITVTYTGPIPQPQDWVVINEIQYNGSAPKGDYLELYNRHPAFAFDLSGFRLEGLGYTFPNGTLIQPNGYLVIVENKASFAAAYDPLLPVLGPYSGKLQGNGEMLRLIKPGLTPESDVVVDEVRYSDAAPWPSAARGFGPSLQLIDAGQDNWRVGNWAAASPTDSIRTTPGKPNSVRSLLSPFPNVWINEVQPINTSGIRDEHGEREPWIELYNAESSAVDLSSLYLSDETTNLSKWQFPAGSTIAPGQFLVLWADGQASQSSASALHTNFRLTSTNGTVLLSRLQAGAPAVIDYVNFLVTSPDASFGSLPDGDPRHRRMLFVATPGAPNNPLIPNVNVAINEWMAAAQSVIRDPADGQFQNWFELYNAGTNTVDLSGFYLTHNPADKTQFRIPAGYNIGPGQFRIVWADGQPEQNAAGGDLHLNFTLNADGDVIALVTPDEEILRMVSFGPQTANISEGLYPDGSESSTAAFLVATPQAKNSSSFANRPPQFTAITNQFTLEGQVLSFRISATDPDQPAQTLTYALNNPPAGATINPSTGQFSWIPSEEQGPGSYILVVRATDNGTPQQSASLSFNVTVREANTPPIIAPLPDISIDEGIPFSFTVGATDSDVPTQRLAFALAAGAPTGTSIDPLTGEFQWTPSEEQGPGTYPITVEVRDNGEPPLVSTRTFRIEVREINNPPIIETIPVQSASEGSTFTFQVLAHDSETPPAKLTYLLENAPAGMVINAESGLITWTPTEADAPKDYNITVRVAEPGGTPSSTTAFLLGVREVNLPPTLDPIADVIAKPGDVLTISPHASDPDLPAQTLTYTSVGTLPPGAVLSSATGVLSWTLSQDPPIGTNRITIRVSDDATPPLFTEETFNIVVRAPARIAINEIMHRPSVPNAEFVELVNYSGINSVDLSGWRLEGYNITFPAGASLAPGAFLCVVRDVATFRSTYGTNGTVLAASSVTVPASGGIIRLVKAGRPGFPDETIDEVGFTLSAPWPEPAISQGASLQLIDPWRDHRRVSNWGALTSSATNAPSQVIPITARWAYWQNAAFPGTNWMKTTFPDTAWPAGGALLYVEGDALPAPKTTALTLGQLSYYFRTHFDFNGNPANALLRFNTVIDDGAVVYLNGEEVFRVGMPAGPIVQSTTATRTVGNAVYEGPFEYPAANLRNGDNVLAVEVHQANSGSSDIVFGATLDVITTRNVSYTPNEPNSVSRDLPAVAPVWINEILANNTSFPDGAGEFDPWIELYNASDSPVLLNGWTLTDDLNNLTKWAFPDDTIIPARGFLVLWLDGNPGQSTPGHLHTSFRISSSAGSVALARRQNGVPTIADFVNYTGSEPNRSIALLEDGNPLTRATATVPSPGASNSNGSSGSAPSISISLTTKSIVLSWKSAAGRAYRVESANTLSESTWETKASGTSNGNLDTFSELLENVPGRFYRVVLP